MTVQRSLFDTPVASPIESAASWVSGTLSGSLATELCIVAVALLGLLMLRGRLPIRDGLQVVVGCFLLLGAPLVAAGLLGIAADKGGVQAASTAGATPYVAQVPLPPPAVQYDPYAGATIRQDQR